MDEHYQYIAHWLGSLISTGAVLGAVAGVLPPIAAIGALIWYYIQIKESLTYRRWRATRNQRKVAHLKAQLAELEAMQLIEHDTEN